MATLGSLTKSVPIAPRQERETAGVPTADPSGADLIQEAIDQIQRYTSELISYDVSPFPPAPESTAANKIGGAPGQPAFTAAGDVDAVPDRDVFASTARERLDFESGYAELPARPGYGVDSDGAVDVTPDAPGVVGYAAGVLANNRFSGIGGDRFTNGGVRTAKSVLTTSTPGLQADRLYSPTGGPGRQLSAPLGPRFVRGSDEVANLRNVAMRLLVNATGKEKIGNSLALDTGGGAIRRNRAKAKAVPSAAQLGLKKVDGGSLLASTGPASLGSSEGKAESLGYAGEGRPSGESYGVLNSPLQVWEDDTALLSSAVAGALALIGISLTLTLVTGGGQLKAVNADVRTLQMPLGESGADPLDGRVERDDTRRSRLRKAANALSSLGILPTFGISTRHPMTACIAKGLRVFFGGDGVGSTLQKILQSSAYFAAVNRSVARDISQVKTAFAGLGQNPAGILRLGAAMEASTTFRFMKTMAALGDVALSSDDPVDSALRLPPRGTVPNELSADSYGMMSILPRSFTSSAAIGLLYGDSGPMRAEVLARSETLRTPLGNDESTPVSPERIPIKLLQQYEEQLDAQAFPFTFHDTRTNELVEFGAFIESMSDGFTANYNPTSAYGRTEDVMTYTSTKRDIGISFWIVATNPRDHELMWRKINKLTTLVYPQYSKGRLISKGGNTFRMPFSQVMTASPLIRLRIGETLTGNYSRFNLTRLFGTGDAMTGDLGNLGPEREINEEDTDLAEFDPGQSYAFSSKTPLFTLFSQTLGRSLALNDTMEGINASQYFDRALRETVTEAKRKYTGGFEAGDRVVLKRNILATLVPIEGDTSAGEKIKQRLRAATGLGEGPKPQIDRALVTANTPCRILRVDAERSRYFVAPIIGDDAPGPGFQVDHDSLTFDPADTLLHFLSQGAIDGEEERDALFDTLDQRILELGGPDYRLFDVDNLSAFTTELQRFFTTGGNPIVRSFEQTRSRGLAGFVTSLSFDYGDSTFEMARGARAPMTVKVTMNFSPIHDIAPGLDADGVNRAPIYTPGHFNTSVAGGDARGFADIRVPEGDGERSVSAAEDLALRREGARRYQQRVEEARRRQAAAESAPAPAAQRAQRQAEAVEANASGESILRPFTEALEYAQAVAVNDAGAGLESTWDGGYSDELDDPNLRSVLDEDSSISVDRSIGPDLTRRRSANGPTIFTGRY